MKRFLVVVDMQKDFVDGALGTPEAVSILPAVVDKIRKFDGTVIATFDTHYENYLDTAEGKKLPVPHCILATDGWCAHPALEEAMLEKGFIPVRKLTFGSVDLPGTIMRHAGNEDFSIELIGLCTDICVVSNALILKACFPNVPISVDAACCAGVTPELHREALDVMRSCQIDIVNA